MILRIVLRPESSASFPISYNEIMQGFIYTYLDKSLSDKVHEDGYLDPISMRKFKLFTFSRLIPFRKSAVEIKQGRIFVLDSVTLVVASPLREFIQSLANNVIKAEAIKLGSGTFYVESISVDVPPSYEERVLVKAISPITVYSTLSASNGKKKTYYYSPFEEEFETLIIENLNKKYRALTGEKVSFSGSIKPFKVGSYNQRIVKYKGTVIKSWDGIYELSLPPQLFPLAFEVGLGAKNSQGFGCIELWEGRK